MDTNGVVTLVYAFPNGTGGNNPPNGANPYAALVQGTNGLLYGTAPLWRRRWRRHGFPDDYEWRRR